MYFGRKIYSCAPIDKSFQPENFSTHILGLLDGIEHVLSLFIIPHILFKLLLNLGQEDTAKRNHLWFFLRLRGNLNLDRAHHFTQVGIDNAKYGLCKCLWEDMNKKASFGGFLVTRILWGTLQPVPFSFLPLLPLVSLSLPPSLPPSLPSSHLWISCQCIPSVSPRCQSSTGVPARPDSGTSVESAYSRFPGTFWRVPLSLCPLRFASPNDAQIYGDQPTCTYADKRDKSM